MSIHYAFFNPARPSQFEDIFQLINDIDKATSCASPRSRAQNLKARERAEERARQEEARRQKALEEQARRERLLYEKECEARRKRERERAIERQQHMVHRRKIDVDRYFNRQAERTGYITPPFDMCETEDAYEMHGEFPGVAREQIRLEFTEPQTLEVSSCARTVTPDDAHSDRDSDDGSSTTGPSAFGDAFSMISSPRSPSPARSLQAMVSDEEEEDALERGEVIVIDNDPAEPAPTAAKADKIKVAKASTSAASGSRFLVKERLQGQYKRTFNFSVPVDEDKVRANLENGILRIMVPKAKRQARRIVIA